MPLHKYFWLVLAILSFIGRADISAALTLEKVFIVAKINNSIVADTLAKNITKKDKTFLYLVIKAKEGGRSIYFSKAQKIRIDGLEIIPQKPEGQFGQIEIKWFKVEPEMYHLNGKGHDPSNPGFLWYTNAGAPGGITDRQPLSPDRINYRKNPLSYENNKWIIMADACPTDPEYDIHDGLGTMRYSVSITYWDGNRAEKRLESAGPERYVGNGISNDVFRVTIQEDISYLGCLTGYFNVPGVFGSYPAQVDKYVGVDCADLVVGGWNRYKKRNISYTNVSGLRYNLVSRGVLKLMLTDHYYDSEGIIYARYNNETETPSDQKIIKIGQTGIYPGDIILFNYNNDKTDRSWDHVGILFADSSEVGEPNGILDGYDLILHCGPAEPRINRFDYEGFVSMAQTTRFAIARWVE